MTDERSPDLTQSLLLELRTQLEEARQSSEYLHVRWTETAARADGLEEQLADARLSAEQGVKVAESMAAEKAALVARVGVLEDLLRRYRDHHDDLTHDATGGGDAGCFCSLCDEAHSVLEVEP